MSVNLLEQIISRLVALEKKTGKAYAYSPYKGTSAIDFTTTTLPHHGDYGIQTADSELQMNANGVILKTAMTAL